MMNASEINDSKESESTWPIDVMDTFAIDPSNPFGRDDHTEEDAWISSLLPVPSTISSSPQLKSSHNQEVSLYTYIYYKEAYQNLSFFSTEPLSNEEWTARRVQRERISKSRRQISPEYNRPVQQYYRSDQTAIESSWSFARDRSVLEHELLQSHVVTNNRAANPNNQEYSSRIADEYPSTRSRVVPLSALFHQESLIDGYRNAVSNTFRFLGSLSRNSREANSGSEATASPTWVESGNGTEHTIRPSHAGLDSMALISGERRRTEVQPFYYNDESDDDTAYWTTGTAVETIYDSDSSYYSESKEVDNVLAMEEDEMQSSAIHDDDFLEWHFTGTQQGNDTPTLSHYPYVQFNPIRL